MPKVTFRTNVGIADAKKLGLDHTKSQFGMTLDASTELAETLDKQGLIYPLSMKAVPQTAELKAVPPEESSVSSSNATEAISQISRMRSKERLEEIIVNDPRATVQSAAQKRLEELGS